MAGGAGTGPGAARAGARVQRELRALRGLRDRQRGARRRALLLVLRGRARTRVQAPRALAQRR